MKYEQTKTSQSQGVIHVKEKKEDAIGAKSLCQNEKSEVKARPVP